MLAGVAWVVSGLVSLVVPGQGTEEIGSSSYYLLETIFCIASVGMLGELAGVHASQAASYGRLGAVGFYAAFIGTTLIFISTAATILAGREVLNFLLVLGYLGALGLVPLGVATLSARVLPQWCGVLLIVAVLGIPIYFFFGKLRWSNTVRPLVAGAGLRALVREGLIGRAIFARELGRP